MEKPTLMVLAAGMGSRYGGLKQMDPMGPNGETVLDYSVFDALRAGFGRVVFVIRRDFEQAFREGVGAKFCDRVPVEYAFQSLDDLPEGFAVPEGREKPWGTAHAIRAARDLVNGPFAVINADDFYGRDAYVQLSQFLSQARDESDKAHFAMVGFELRRTLSDFGSVARGICRANANGYLESVVEMTKIFKTDTGAENREDGVAPIQLTGGELVSMNMWGFSPALVPLLETKFREFLAAKGGELKSEAYIPMVVDELIREGKADTLMLPTKSEWFGVTYREDKPQVMASIARLVEAGEYPANLWG